MIRGALLIGLVVSSLAACSTAPREAAPLEIERDPVPVERAPAPLVIRRAALEDVIAKGPGRFFERMPVTPYLVGRRFVGYRVMQLYGRAEPHPDGVQVGDVVTSVNELPVSRPDEFMKVWTGAAKRDRLVVDVLRGEQRHTIVYRIVD